MASKLFMQGKQITGTVANALKINCKDKDGNKSTVQAELNKINNGLSSIDELAYTVNLLSNNLNGLTLYPCTQEYYDSLESPRPSNTLYIITG